MSERAVESVVLHRGQSRADNDGKVAVEEPDGGQIGRGSGNCGEAECEDP